LYQGEGRPKETRRDFKGANKSRPGEKTEFNMRTLSSRASDEENALKEEPIKSEVQSISICNI